MGRQPLTNPRKAAIQQRARLTVGALLDATARILVKDGYDKASTNKIALAAGVSIGSLYQYFPSKEALVAAVVDRHMTQMLDLVRDEIVKVAARPVDVAVRRLVTAMIDAHRVDPKLHRVLAEQVPRSGRLVNIEAMDREAYKLVRAYLDGHREELQVADLDTATFVCVKTVEAMAHGAVIGAPAILSGVQIERLTDEVTRLIVRYLRG
jgi:AcrR family transcriptional regulator